MIVCSSNVLSDQDVRSAVEAVDQPGLWLSRLQRQSAAAARPPSAA